MTGYPITQSCRKKNSSFRYKNVYQDMFETVHNIIGDILTLPTTELFITIELMEKYTLSYSGNTFYQKGYVFTRQGFALNQNIK